MNMRKFRMALLLSMMLMTAWNVSTAQAEYRMGVLAKRGSAQTVAKWQATADYLTRQLGETVTIAPLKLYAVEKAVRNGDVDFILVDSVMYKTLQNKYRIKPVVTPMDIPDTPSSETDDSVIFVRRDSSIKSIRQVRGKRLMCVRYSSYSGGLTAWRLLKANGIDPQTDCSEFLEGGDHESVVNAVMNGQADVGTVRSRTIEGMHRDGRIDMDALRILHRSGGGLPAAHTGRRSPQWPLAAVPDVDDAVVQRLRSALLAMPADSAAARDAGINGWAAAASR
jgi:two-component system, LuxR family, sensor histidine kinase TtrS